MAVNKDPILKRCRYLGISPAVVGINKSSNRNPNANSRRKVSGMEYSSRRSRSSSSSMVCLKSPSITTLRSHQRWRVRQVTT